MVYRGREQLVTEKNIYGKGKKSGQDYSISLGLLPAPQFLSRLVATSFLFLPSFIHPFIRAERGERERERVERASS